MAQLGGEKGEPILLAVFIFIAGTVYIKHTSMEWRLVISSDLSCHVLVPWCVYGLRRMSSPWSMVVVLDL